VTRITDPDHFRRLVISSPYAWTVRCTQEGSEPVDTPVCITVAAALRRDAIAGYAELACPRQDGPMRQLCSQLCPSGNALVLLAGLTEQDRSKPFASWPLPLTPTRGRTKRVLRTVREAAVKFSRVQTIGTEAALKNWFLQFDGSPHVVMLSAFAEPSLTLHALSQDFAHIAIAHVHSSSEIGSRFGVVLPSLQHVDPTGTKATEEAFSESPFPPSSSSKWAVRDDGGQRHRIMYTFLDRITKENNGS